MRSGTSDAIVPARRHVLTIVLTAGIATAFFGSSVATPLYVVYQARWAVSPLITSLAFVAYAMGVLPSLVLSGSVLERHDDRSPFLILALGAIGGGAALIAAAPGTPILILGRFVCGVGTGLMINAGNLALIEQGGLDRARAAGLGTIALTIGAGAGPLVGAGFVAIDVLPLTLPYLIVTALAAACGIGLWAFGAPPRRPAPSCNTDDTDLAAQRALKPAVFLLACLTILIAWSLGATLLALGGLVLADLLGTVDVAAAAGAVALFQVCAGLTQVSCLRRGSTWGALMAGTALMAVSLTAAALFIAGRMTGPLLGAIVLAGVGYGAGFAGSAGLVAHLAPKRRRATYLSAFYATGYAANWVPVLLARVSDEWPISAVLKAYCVSFACLAAALACAVPYLKRDSNPRR